MGVFIYIYNRQIEEVEQHIHSLPVHRMSYFVYFEVKTIGLTTFLGEKAHIL